MLNHFNFKKVSDYDFLLTNDFGQYIFLSEPDFSKLITKKIPDGSDLQKALQEKLFLLEPTDLFSADIAQRLREIKQYVFAPTSLHIFVVTNTCNLQCIYCQAQAHKKSNHGFMNIDTAHKAVDIALQSPAKNLTFEFQGGEPLINYPVIKEIVTYTESLAHGKNIVFTVVSNLSLLTDEMLDFFIQHEVSISTSLDGPQILHDHNRPPCSGTSSHEPLMRSVRMIHDKQYSVSGIETTTKESLSYAREIVREYEKIGSNGVFIRPLTPLGFAKDEWSRIGYKPEEFLQFYKEAFNEIIAINKSGKLFPEQHAVILLKKIMCGQGINYMDLRSPCGAGIGQLAYYYDGNIYTCDEARMVAESGDQAFLLGNVGTSSYYDIVSCDTCRATCASSVTESLPGCCDCVYQPYCGVCPVVNYAMAGDIFPREAHSYRCQIFSGILDFLFELLRKNDPATIQILESWLMR